MKKMVLAIVSIMLTMAGLTQTGTVTTDVKGNQTPALTTGPAYTDTAAIAGNQLQELRNKFGQHKKYTPEYEKLVLPALSFFPELKNYRITFKVRNHGAPLSTRPSYGSMFRHASKRTYMVFISSDTSSQWKEIQLNRVPIMAQIGIIGHEISHIIEFKEKNTFGLIGLGVNHISTPYMNKFEFQADSIGIAHGMGDYFLVWAIHAREAFGATDPQQLDLKGEMSNYSERYMSPATIRRYMEEMEKIK
jgi:hypothetical protein